MSTPQPGPGLARILSCTVYVPGEEPRRFKAGEILAAGLQEGTPVCAVMDPETKQVTEYLGLPIQLVKGEPSGLVAPSSGRILVPPT